jgi:RES domain-containing protein
MHFQGKIYRALNPIHAREPFSGRGAALYGGRFNPKGVPALYTSLTIMTTISEANQAGSLQPTMIISYDADFDNIFDARDEHALEQFGMNMASLADAGWRDSMRNEGKAPVQRFAESLIEEGHHGLLVQSFARGASETDLNLVLWSWGSSKPARLTLIDDEGRLTSWP